MATDKPITRRDFVAGVMVGSGSALLARRSLANAHSVVPGSDLGDEWYGYGGIGDYANSHGNTPDVVKAAHGLMEGTYARPDEGWADTGEIYDTVIVGAGIAGLGAALEFHNSAGDKQRCLVIDNHPVFGGESKRNEFDVEGTHLIGPQGANGFSVPDLSSGVDGDYASSDAKYYAALGIPQSFDYPELDARFSELEFGRDNYGFMYWLQDRITVGHFHRDAQSGVYSSLAVDAWRRDLANTPLPQTLRAGLLEWMNTRVTPYQGENLRNWLDTMTYQAYLEDQLRLPPIAAEYAHPIVAGSIGLGADVVSAYGAFAIGLPGFRGYEEMTVSNRHSFPGGNDGFARYFIKRIRPDAITGGDNFADIMNGPIDFSALDDPRASIRLRLGATVIHVAHDREPAQSQYVWVSYVADGRVYRVRARGVVMASGGWMNRYVVRDLPADYRKAYETFYHAPFLVANVAVRNWRFMERAGITACRYEGEFGFSCNIRQPMWAGDYQPPLDPDQPALLTFYVPFYYPGASIRDQGIRGRAELLGTSFAVYEQRIRRQLTDLFSRFGFDDQRDIAGIILNRWGHAYVVPQPGFYFGRDRKPAPRDVVMQAFGRVAFGHSELRGNQHWGSAADEGARALGQVL